MQRKAEEILLNSIKIVSIFSRKGFPRERWRQSRDGVIAAGHSAPPFSYVVAATLRWETAKTQQCGTEKNTKI